MDDRTKEKLEKARKRKEEKIIFSHHLAEEIAGFATNYFEVDEIIERVDREFKRVAARKKPEIREQAVDDWGEPIGAETR